MAWLGRINQGIRHVRLMTWIKPEFYREMLLPSGDTTDGDNAETPENDADRLSFTKVFKHILRYGFVEVADDILFALLVGELLGGVLCLAVPGDLMSSQYARWLSHPVMMLVGIPLYI